MNESSLTLTIRGRLRTRPFDFYFNSNVLKKFHVDGVQVEVDAGYENDRVYLIEAKMGEKTNFHVRQLYFPFRMWKEENIQKK